MRLTEELVELSAAVGMLRLPLQVKQQFTHRLTMFRLLCPKSGKDVGHNIGV